MSICTVRCWGWSGICVAAWQRGGKSVHICTGSVGLSNGEMVAVHGACELLWRILLIRIHPFLQGRVQILRHRSQPHHPNRTRHLLHSLRHDKSASCLAHQWWPVHSLECQAPAIQLVLDNAVDRRAVGKQSQCYRWQRICSCGQVDR